MLVFFVWLVCLGFGLAFEAGSPYIPLAVLKLTADVELNPYNNS